MEEGRFNARGVGGKLGYANTGTPQVGVELEVTEGEFAGERVTWYGYFTDASKERTLKALRVLGWKGDDLTDLAGIDANEVSITVKNEEYNGDWNLKVAWINPLGEVGAGIKNPMTPEQLKSFAASMKGDAIASRGGAGASKPASKPKPKPASRPTTNQQPPDDFGAADDDIPF